MHILVQNDKYPHPSWEQLPDAGCIEPIHYFVSMFKPDDAPLTVSNEAIKDFFTNGLIKVTGKTWICVFVIHCFDNYAIIYYHACRVPAWTGTSNFVRYDLFTEVANTMPSKNLRAILFSCYLCA